MIWAIRRQLRGWVSDRKPTNCSPPNTSQRRNSTRNWPLGRISALPTTSACALICRQAGNCGRSRNDSRVCIKALESIKRNIPELSRSAPTTRATSRPRRPASVALDVTRVLKKSTTAIGTGSIFPCVMSTRSSASASKVVKTIHPTARLKAKMRVVKYVRILFFMNLLSKGFTGIEIKRDILPNVILIIRQFERLT